MGKKIFFIIAVVVVLVNTVAFAGVQWFSLHEGMEKAGAEKKPLIVDFYYGKGCARCEFLETQVYGNTVIAQKIMKDFIPVRIDLTHKLSEEERKLGEKYEYKNDCLLLFLDCNGDIISTPQGKKLCFADKVEPQWFLNYMDMITSSYKTKQRY